MAFSYGCKPRLGAGKTFRAEDSVQENIQLGKALLCTLKPQKPNEPQIVSCGKGTRHL